MSDKLNTGLKHTQYPAIRNMRRVFSLLALFFVSFLLAYSWSSYQGEKRDQSAELSSIAELSGNSLDSYFSHYENSLKVLAQETVDGHGSIDIAHSHQLLKRFLQTSPDLLIANINRPDGQILVSSDVLPGKPLPSMANAPSFIMGREELLKGGDFNIGRPAYGPLAKGWVIPLRYAIRDKQGKLLYILVAVLPLARQQIFWHDLSLPANTALGLLRDDAHLISRYPDSGEVDAEKIYGKPRAGILIEHLKQQGFPARGNVEGYIGLYQKNFLFGYRRLAHYPITFFVTMPVTNVYLQWWQKVQFTYLLLILSILGSYVVYRWAVKNQLTWELERELHEEKLRSIFEGSNDAIVLLSDGVFIDCNARTLAIFGMQEKSALVGHQPSDFSPPVQPGGRKSQDAAADHIAEALQSGKVQFEWMYRRNSGETFPAEVLLSAFNYGGERILQGTISDITEQKNTERALQRESSTWIQAMDSFVDVIYLLDAKRHLVRANKVFYTMMRVEPEQAIGKHITEIIHPLGETVLCPVCRAQEERLDTVITMEVDHPDNPSGRPIEISVKTMRDEAGMPTGTLMSIHDLSHTRKIEENLLESEERFRRVAAEAPFPMMIHAENGEVLEINKAWSEATGYSHADIPDITSWLQNAYWDNVPAMQRMVEKLYGIKHRVDQGERVIRCKDGSFRTWHFSAAPVGQLPDGRKYIVSMAQDVSDRKAAQQQIEFLAYHDALTGLPNRLLAKDHLEQATLVADREKTLVALLFVDLDKFKTINDSLGHVIGDGLLKSVSLRLRECLRETDTLSRHGGDEFLIVLNNMPDTESITVVAEKILARLAEPFEVDNHDLAISLSIGVSVYPDDGKDFDTLLKKSDTAMYQAKESGRNTYRFHTEQMNIDAIEHLRMRNGLRRALEHGEFVLHYQPQISLANGAVTGAEALIRWHHPEFGMVPPGRFISIAEDSGLIVPIGEWVLREACRQAVAWHKAGLPELIIAVNLSAVQFKRGDMEKSVLQALVESGLNPSLLELELTESILIKDTEKVLAKVRQLKSLGVKLSIDDFGTGYSSLSYLKQFNVDKLKIDQSFVRDMADDPNDAAIVRAIIQMAKSLNLTTIAEGVEDERQLALLRLQQCDEVQGYHFARPMPAEEFANYMANQRRLTI
ncbi:MAG TPA: EAL domain-containing protein [Gallionellaceae bacterium]|nr:EAL domain-containing protein [Gallionellaceae bacterium]